MRDASLAPAAAQLAHFLDPALPFGAEDPREELLQLAGKAWRRALRRDRDRQIAAAQHCRRMQIGQLGRILDMDDRTGLTRGQGERAALRLIDISDEDQLGARQIRRAGPAPLEPLAGALFQFARGRRRKHLHRARPRLIEPGQAACGRRVIADQSKTQPRQVERKRQHRSISVCATLNWTLRLIYLTVRANSMPLFHIPGLYLWPQVCPTRENVCCTRMLRALCWPDGLESAAIFEIRRRAAAPRLRSFGAGSGSAAWTDL